MSETPPLLRIRGLTVKPAGEARAEIEDFSLTLDPGSTLTLLGETGSGKAAVLRLLAGTLRDADLDGTIQVRDGEVRPLADRIASDLRVAYLPGPHRPVLNPHATVLSQLTLVVARKLHQPRSSARAELAIA